MTVEDREDRIIIRNLGLECVIGVNPEERTRKQRIILDVELSADLSMAGKSDAIEDTINYSDLANRIVDHAQNSTCMLLEKLAEEIAQICLEHERSRSVRVLIMKPEALRGAAYPGVEIYRSKR